MGNQAFRGTNYLFLTAEKGELKGEMELTRHGNFHIEEGVGCIYIKTAEGNYVGANDEHHAVLRREKQADCKWTLERSSGGAAIRSKHGGYLSMDENGVVRIKELQKAGDQEMFSEVALL